MVTTLFIFKLLIYGRERFEADVKTQWGIDMLKNGLNDKTCASIVATENF